ncbi:MAG: methyltransferase domain-containing protein [Agarilytica sp.]
MNEERELSLDECIWHCPHPNCQESLSPAGEGARVLACSNGHQYDRARQGYVNLLLANQKKSHNPGDSSEMVEARRAFLSAGHYRFLFDAIEACIRRHMSSECFRLLDLGCGDGSYLHAISAAFPEAKLWGSDISKNAIKRAATYVKGAECSVASNFHLPFVASSLDLLLSVFSPVDAAEVARVLRPEGIFIRVLPGENHFRELKEAIYDIATSHEAPVSLTQGTLLESIRVENKATLSNASLAQLIGMTPLNWRGDSEGKKALLKCEEFTLQFDFVLQVYCFE